jgi:Tfp pilus assembly protein PilZ
MPDVSHPDNIFTIVYRQGEKLQCNQPVEVPPSYKPLEAIGTPIKLKADTLSEWVNQYGNDIGLNGILLRDPSPLPVGSTVLFELILKDSPYPFKTRGKVVWSEGEKMVVEFDPLNSDAQELLARILYEAGEKRGTDNNPTDPNIPLLEEEGLTDPALNTLATQAGMEVTIERATEDKPHKVVVQYDASNIEEFFEKYPLVIGREGIMVKTPEPLMPIPHDSVEFELRLKDGTLLLSGVGEVDWARKEDPEHPGVPPGMGIKFSNRSPETEMNFGKVLAQQENKDGYLRPGIPSSGELSIAQKPTLQKLRRELIQEIYYLFEDAIRKSSSQELLDITFWIDPKTGKLIKDPAQQSGAIMVNPLWLPGRGIALKSVENAHLWHLLGKVKDKDLVQETILRTIRELPLLPFKFPTNPGGEGTTSPIGPANDNALFSGSSENPKVSSPVEIILNRDPNNTPSYLIARFDVESPEDFMQGYGQYLTRGGLFLPTTQSISNGAEFPFEVQMGSTNLYGTGKVIYVQHTGPQHPEKLAGIGIQFIDLVLESRVLLEGLMLEKDSKKN